MLASLLTTSAPQASTASTGASVKSLGKSRAGDDFGRVFKQQNAQPAQEKPLAKEKNDLHKPADSQGAKGAQANADSGEQPSSQTADTLKDLAAQEIDTDENKDLTAYVPTPVQDELFSEDTLQEQNGSWLFWVQFVQDAASYIDQPLDAAAASNIFDQAAVDDASINLAAPPVSLPMDAAPASINQASSGEELTSFANLLVNAGQPKSPFAVLNNTGMQEKNNRSEITDDLAVGADVLAHTEGAQLVTASLPISTKTSIDTASNTRELPLVADVSVPSARVESAPATSVQDAKWLGQTEPLAQAASTENKSFLQLRFNQQTLASDLVEKTGWLIEHKIDTAQIQLDPPELGPIAVKIHSHQEQVSVSFIVANPQVRDAMDQTLQRLKELLQEQGINLSHADVNDQRQQRDQPDQDASSLANNGDVLEEDAVSINLPQNELGVDHFV